MSISASDRHFRRRVAVWAVAVGLAAAQLPVAVSGIARLTLRVTGADVHFASLGGHWLTGLELRGVAADFGTLTIRADTVRGHLRLWALARGHVHLSRLEAARPTVTWSADARSAPAEDSDSWPVQIDAVKIAGGAFIWADTAWAATELQLSGAFQSDGPVRLDRLQGYLQWRGGDGPIRMHASGTYESGGLHLDTLRIAGPGTSLAASGRMGVRGPSDLRLQSDSLQLALLTPFLPVTDAVAQLRAHVTGRDGSLELKASGAVTDGSQLTIAVHATPSAHLLELDQLRGVGLNPATWIAGAPEGAVTGWARGTLSFGGMDSLGGNLAIRVTESMIAGRSLHSAELDMAVEQGQGTVRASVYAGSGSVAGQGTWTQAPLALEMEGIMQRVDLGVVAPGLDSRLNGIFSVDLHDSLEVHLDLDTGRLGALPVHGGKLFARFGPNSADARATIQGGAGTLGLQARRAGSSLTGSVEMKGWDLTSALGDTTASSSIALRTYMWGTWPPDTLAILAHLEPSRWQGIHLDTGQLNATMSGGRLEFDGVVNEVHGGEATLAGLAELPYWRLTTARFRNIDLSALGLGPATRLRGTAQASGYGVSQIATELRLLDSKVNAQPIDSLQVEMTTVRETATLAARAMMPDGRLELAATADSLTTVPQLTVQHAAFEGLNLGRVLGLDQWSTDLHGRVDRGALNASGQSNLALHLTESSVNDLGIKGGSIALGGTSDGLTAKAHITLTNGHVRVDSLRWRTDSSYVVRGSAVGLGLDQLVGMEANVTGSIDLDGHGLDPGSMMIRHLALDLHSSQVAGIGVEKLRLEGAKVGNQIRLDTLDLHTQAGWLRGGGEAALSGGSGQRLAIQGRLTNAQPLHRWIPLEGAVTDTLWAVATSDGESVQVQAGTRTGPAEWHAARVLQAELAADAIWRAGAPLSGQAELSWSRLSVPGLSVRSGGATMTLARDTARFSGRVILDEARHATVAGSADLQNRVATIDELRLQLQAYQWELDQQAQVLATNGLRIRNLLLATEGQEVALDGVLNVGGRQNLRMSLYNVQVEPFADLFGMSALGGTLNGDVFWGGSADAPVMDGSIALDVRSAGERAGRIDASADYQSGTLSLTAGIYHVDSSTLRIGGALPADLRLRKTEPLTGRRFDLALEANQFNIGWLTPFMPPEEVGGVGGTLSGRMVLGGTQVDPSLNGTLKWQGGHLVLPALGIVPEDIELAVQAAGDTIVVAGLHARSGLGSMHGSGYVVLDQLTQARLDLEATSDEFDVVDTPALEGAVDAEVRIGGTTARPELTGHVEMAGAVIVPESNPATFATGPVQFTDEDLHMLENYFNLRVTGRDTTTFSLVDALAMDMSVGLPGNVWLRASQGRSMPEMNVLLSGSVNLVKEPFAEQQLHGTVTVVPERSYIRQFGRRFDIRTGRVTFAGPATDPFFDVQAAYAVRSASGQDSPVTILMETAGRLGDPGTLELDLRSEPVQLGRSDILSYIATGRPAADAFQLTGEGALQAGGQALGELSSLVAGAAGAELGLDVLRIQHAGSQGINVTAGKHVSRRLFTSVSWPMNANEGSGVQAQDRNKELIVEYALYSWMLARLRGDAGALGLSLLYQYTW